jgi:hypothetical protein
MKTFVSLIIGVACVAAWAEPIRVNLAPDQPLPHVYFDDPLIVEIQSDEETTASVSLEIKREPSGEAVNVALDPISVHAKGTQWRAVDNAPKERGFYHVHARVESNGVVFEKDDSFCRIDRPASDFSPPVRVTAEAWDAKLQLAIKGASVSDIVFNAASPSLQQTVEDLASAGFKIAARLEETNPGDAEAAAKNIGEHTTRWELRETAPEALIANAKAIRKGGSKAPATIAVNDDKTVESMLSKGVGLVVRGFTYRASWPKESDIKKVQSATRRAGYEDMPTLVALAKPESPTLSDGPRLYRQILTDIALGAPETEIDSSMLWSDSLGVGYPYLCAISQQLKGADYVGKLDVGDGVVALGFRKDADWMLALWLHSGKKEVVIRVENATKITMFDACDNPLPAPELKDGTITVSLDEEPRIIFGQAGSILTQIAVNAVRENAAEFLEPEEARKALPPEIVDFIKKFSSFELKGYNRLDFFTLVKIFPRIEELWTSGGLSRSTAGPALASLQRLTRALCTLEQERGEAFIEPLQKTLDNCGQFQSLYLTGSSASQDNCERPDWLLDKVESMMDEAERLNGEGRTIEACAVATLAEWRARALEIAAKAQPLSQPEKEIKPPAPTPPDPPQAKTEASSNKKVDDNPKDKSKDKTSQKASKPTKKRGKKK